MPPSPFAPPPSVPPPAPASCVLIRLNSPLIRPGIAPALHTLLASALMRLDAVEVPREQGWPSTIGAPTDDTWRCIVRDDPAEWGVVSGHGLLVQIAFVGPDHPLKPTSEELQLQLQQRLLLDAAAPHLILRGDEQPTRANNRTAAYVDAAFGAPDCEAYSRARLPRAHSAANRAPFASGAIDDCADPHRPDGRARVHIRALDALGAR